MISMEFIRGISRLSNIIRYNTWGKVKNETVAEHSYFVCLYTKKICDYLEVNDFVKLKAIEFAIIHDAAEIFTNDITYDAKQSMPELQHILEAHEKNFIQTNFPENYKDLYESSSYDNYLAKMIVKAADIYSVIQYCDNEVSLGNKNFQKLLDQSIQRLTIAIQNIGGANHAKK